MSGGIYAKSVDSHLDKLGVAVDKIVGHISIFSVEVNAVACNLPPPARRVVPAEVGVVMPLVVHVMVFAVGIFHQREACAILLVGGK